MVAEEIQYITRMGSLSRGYRGHIGDIRGLYYSGYMGVRCRVQLLSYGYMVNTRSLTMLQVP